MVLRGLTLLSMTISQYGPGNETRCKKSFTRIVFGHQMIRKVITDDHDQYAVQTSPGFDCGIFAGVKNLEFELSLINRFSLQCDKFWLYHLQSVVNGAARIVANTPKFIRISIHPSNIALASCHG